MCIPIGAFDPGAPRLALNDKAEKLRKIMNVVLIVHFGISILKIFFVSPLSAISDFISCAILYCGISSANFCQLLIYMILCLISCLDLFIKLGYMF